jgi:hypothetical protein
VDQSLEAIAFAAFASRNTVSKAPADCIGNVRENDRAISHRLGFSTSRGLVELEPSTLSPGIATAQVALQRELEKQVAAINATQDGQTQFSRDAI